MKSTFLVCPGRGSYAKPELGTLNRLENELGSEGQELLASLEEVRARLDPDLPSLRELDAAERFRPGLHLLGRNASPLIYACTLLDERLHRSKAGPEVIGGNSLGFYSALVLSGVLDPVSGLRLISTMARLQERGPQGGQVLWTLLEEDWSWSSDRKATLLRIIRDLNRANPKASLRISIFLGGHIVVAGSEDGVRKALEALPQVKLGKRDFPFRLAFHGPFHNPLLLPVAELALEELGDLKFKPPRIPLVDGRGFVWSPLWGDPEKLRFYTLKTQVTETFDFTSTLRVGIQEFATNEIYCLGPGNTLRAPLGHVETWLTKCTPFPFEP
jgi:malonyl CoA-acyl carrier protein transacylase